MKADSFSIRKDLEGTKSLMNSNSVIMFVIFKEDISGLSGVL